MRLTILDHDPIYRLFCIHFFFFVYYDSIWEQIETDDLLINL